MSRPEVIDIDDLDVFCTGIRHRARLDRPPPLLPRKRGPEPVTISLVDSDSEDTKFVLSAIPQDASSSSDQCTELQRITQLELSSRTALRDIRSTTKRTTAAIKMATDAVKTHELKRKDRTSEVIEISSDSEPELWPSKKQRLDQPTGSPFVKYENPDHSMEISKLEEECSRAELHSPTPPHSDNDDDYIDLLASLDISNEANWVPPPESKKAEDLTPVHDSTSPSSSHLLPPFRIPRKKPPVDPRRLPFDWASASLWGKISRDYGLTRFPKPFYHARRQERLFHTRSPSLYYETGFTKLELTAKYPHLMSGSINKIIQAQDSVVICAVVEGGLPESDDEAENPLPPPENRPGSLAVYHHGQVHVQPAHCHTRRTSRDSAMKYYSVNDVTFNPLNPRQFLSSGNDLAVRVWEIIDCDNNRARADLAAIRYITFDSKPQDLVYAPDGSALAITCYDGFIALYSQDLFEGMLDVDSPPNRIRAAPKGSGHATGCTVWGKGPSAQLLFSSSEPTEKDDHRGFHHAFDTLKGSRVIQFDATEAGDEVTLSPDGATLVLFTSGKEGTHPVRLYDVRRRVKETYEVIELEKFQVRSVGSRQEELADSGEVNQASFSPDGCLLAVARNDNALHVYDVRALSRGPLCCFEHHESDAVGGGGCGIVAANWFQGRNRTGIITGGNDGCVRLWEPALGTDEMQGMVIGRTDFDVGHFSVGNAHNGELPLVIGDSGGGLHTYDFTNPEGIRI